MQSIPVDMSRLGTVRCTVGPEPKVTNRETGEIKKNRDGVTVYTVGVVVRQQDSRRADTIEIQVPGEPAGIEEGMPVVVSGLVAFAWTQGTNHGISFRADSITPVPPPNPPAAGPASASAASGRGGKSGGDA